MPEYETQIRRPGEQMITLLDVLPTVSTTAELVYWVMEKLGSRVNNVAIQSLDFTGTGQGTKLGESDFVFERQSAETRTAGHIAKIAIQTLEDSAQLQAYLQTVMRYMVRFDMENQILNGDGTGKQIDGLINRATAYDVTLDANVTGLQQLDIISTAILQCSLTFFPATATTLNPRDVNDIKLLKDDQKRYLFVATRTVCRRSAHGASRRSRRRARPEGLFSSAR